MKNIIEPNKAILTKLSKIGEAQATLDEVAAYFHITRLTLEKSFKQHPILKTTYEEAKANGLITLRMMQIALAKTNASMAIWLGKQYLGQRDKLEHFGANGSPLQFTRIEHVIIDKDPKNTKNFKDTNTASLRATPKTLPL